MTTQSVEERIRRLLAIAEDCAASPSEREIALERASILMARHSITSLSEPTTRTENVETRVIIIPGGRTTASLAHAYGIHAIALASGCSTYYTDRRTWTGQHGGPHILVHLVGFPSDLDWLTPLTTVVIAYATTGWKRWCRNNPRRYKPMKPANQRRARAGFILGYAQGVAQRIRTTRHETIAADKTSGHATALVVRDRAGKVKEFMASLDLGEGQELDADERARAAGFTDGYASGLGNRRTRLADSPSSKRITS